MGVSRFGLVGLRAVGFRAVALACLACLAAAGVSAEPRTALVVGNAAYRDAPLANPVNDASDVAAALRGAGFDVILRTDADKRALEEAVRTFGSTLKTRGGVGLFYFAGHGVQVAGENYIVPVGPTPPADRLKVDFLTASQVVDAMATAGNALNIVVLDACRNNPIAGASTHGLSRIDSGSRLFVSFATSPGAVALDGSGRNSPFTKHLVQALALPDLTLEDTFKRTLKGVYQETSGEQVPWLSSSFFGDFVFRPRNLKAGLQAAPPPPPAPTAAAPPPTFEAARPPSEPPPVEPAPTAALFSPHLAGVYRAAGRNPDGSRYKGMVAITRDRGRVSFTWWIGKQVFRGDGDFAGRMLVVNWGAKKPVIYSVRGGSLDGEWADGTATERLDPVAVAAESPVSLSPGRYRVEGRNPNGSRYAGSLVLSRQADIYRLRWQVGSTSYNGTGTLAGNLLTVEWGSATPVVYALAADGSLRGLWDAGRGEETLWPE